MRLRVVCGLGLTIASFSPTSAFNRVDFPALGRPRMHTKPERKGMAASLLPALLRWWRCARVRRAVPWNSRLQNAVHPLPKFPLFAVYVLPVPSPGRPLLLILSLRAERRIAHQDGLYQRCPQKYKTDHSRAQLRPVHARHESRRRSLPPDLRWSRSEEQTSELQ